MTKDELLAIARSTQFLVTAAAAMSAFGGAVAGYQYAHKKLEQAFAERANAEIEEARTYFRNLYKVGPDDKPMSPEDVLEQLHPDAAEAMKSYSPPTEDVVEEAPVEESTVEDHNIFTDPQPDPGPGGGWDYQTELKIREENPDRPYVISEEEWSENELEWEIDQLTYFAGDDTLVDDQDTIIPNQDEVVGDDNLMRFGAGTNDKNTLFVANPKMEQLFEVVRDPGKASVQLYGFDDEEKELKHSHVPRSQRWDDA